MPGDTISLTVSIHRPTVGMSRAGADWAVASSSAGDTPILSRSGRVASISAGPAVA
ncbi:MAG TPA: hypothetical protein VFG15_29605 [Amycolatopsis sp.]|nr:hypothetical protein [Amycolatopsis sp.]